MTDAEKLTEICIFVESKREKEKVLKILQEKRPELKWKFFNGSLIDRNNFSCPIILVTDYLGEKNTLWTCSEETASYYDFKFKKIEEILGKHYLDFEIKDSSDYCSCNGKGYLNGFGALTFTSCSKCGKEKQF